MSCILLVGSTVWAGPKQPHLFVYICLLHTVTALIALAFSALGTMATPTSRGLSDDGEALLTVIGSPDHVSSIKMLCN